MLIFSGRPVDPPSEPEGADRRTRKKTRLGQILSPGFHTFPMLAGLCSLGLVESGSTTKIPSFLTCY